jgi:osmotically-inducible protein OsmY
MNRKLAIAALFAGAMTLPVIGYSAETAKDALKDSVITAKIKAEMVKDPVVSALNIKVDTDDKGVVSLSGNAKSKAEVDKAIAIAKNTKGVSSVKSDIKIATP